jgi:hypothetical protein
VVLVHQQLAPSRYNRPPLPKRRRVADDLRKRSPPWWSLARRKPRPGGSRRRLSVRHELGIRSRHGSASVAYRGGARPDGAWRDRGRCARHRPGHRQSLAAARPAGNPATSASGGRRPPESRADLGVPAGCAGAEVRRPPQLPSRPSRRPTPHVAAGRLLPDHHAATAAGYPPAPPPAGTLEVGGVYLTPTGQRLHRRCQQAADRLGFPVPCPTLLPALSPGAVPPTPCDQRFRCQAGAGFVLEEDGFVVPPGYVGAAGQAHGRLVAAAAGQASNHIVACEGTQQPVASVMVRGIRGRLVQCSGSGVTSTACWCAGGSGAW